MNETKEERAVRVVKEFNRIRPSLSSFASSLAGKRVEVKAGPVTQTDGKTIFLTPPLTLAHKPEHVRNLCYQRGDDHRELCPGCRRIEELYTNLHHELGHIIFNSLNFQIDPLEYQSEISDIAVEFGGISYASKLQKRIREKNRYMQAVELANKLNPYVGQGWNFFEDYRMEELVTIAQPGFATMVWHDAENILVNGIEDLDGKITFWKSRHVDIQSFSAWLFAAQGHEIENHFDPKVVAPVRNFIEESQNIPFVNPMHAVLMSVAFVGFMKQHGFFQEEDDEQQSEPGRDDGNESGGESGESTDGTGSSDRADETAVDADDQGTADSSNSSRDEGEQTKRNTGNNEHDNSSGNSDDTDDRQSGQDLSQSDSNDKSDGDSTTESNKDDIPDDGTGNGGQNSPVPSEQAPSPEQIGSPHQCTIHVKTSEVQSNEANDDRIDFNDLEVSKEDLTAIISQVENYDEYTKLVGELVYVNPIENLRQKRFKPVDPPNMMSIASSIIHARRVFSESKLDKNYRNLTKGKVDGAILGKRAWGDDERIFKKKLRAQGVDFEVCIGLDLSSSTSSDGLYKNIIHIGYSTAELLQKVDVNFSLYGHRTGHATGRINQVLLPCKTINEPWDNVAKEKCLSLIPAAGSLDGHNLQVYRKVLERSRARKKLLIYFTDGEIPATLRDKEIPIVQKEIKILRRLGIAMLGVGLETDSPNEVGMDTVLVTDPTDLKSVLKEIEKRINNVGV
ncbi:hypothetical protein SEA_GIBBLES_78 [Gordonia phage Gibbles]|nr:hypothetical protein SEA_GIBBLES_78 [Gordonia phage Gibbles]